MRSAILARAFPVLLFLVVVVAPACSIDTTGTDPATFVSDAPRQLDEQYQNCPSPTTVCDLYHPGSVVTGYCGYGACFEMSHGDEVRMVAADELGDFPTVWFAWHEGVLAPAEGRTPCILTKRGNKTRLEIPVLHVRCAVSLSTAEHLYFEHFASNPVSGCLGWVECKQY